MADAMLQHYMYKVWVNFYGLTIEIERVLFSEVRFFLGDAASTHNLLTTNVHGECGISRRM